MALTGKFRFRRGLFGRPVLEIQEKVVCMPPYSRRVGVYELWRRATMDDLLCPELRHLISKESTSC